MAPTPRSIPANFPQPLGTQLLKADFHRQFSILRQEVVTDLLGVLNDAREPGVRAALIRILERQLKAGATASEKAAESWPTREEAEQVIQAKTEAKPALARKHQKLFEQLDRTHQRHLELLDSSFENIRKILDRVRGPVPQATGATAASPASRVSGVDK